MKTRLICSALLLCGLSTACSNADDVDQGGAGGSGADAVGRAFVLNEFAAQGADEWLELGNRGNARVDLSGYAIADSDKTTGKPKASAKMVFPAGTVLEPGGRLLVMLNKTNVGVGPYPQAECVPGAVSMCLYASFGLSAKNGENVHLLGADDSVLASTPYPQSLVVAAGQSACRLPDLTGEFTACAPTPGAANAGP